MGDNQTTSPPLGNTAGLLPSPADVSSAATQIPVSSADVQPLTTVKLDELGPLVVNEDGTMSRITNWAQMTPAEQANTMRVIGKRNKQRMEKLKSVESASSTSSQS